MHNVFHLLWCFWWLLIPNSTEGQPDSTTILLKYCRNIFPSQHNNIELILQEIYACLLRECWYELLCGYCKCKWDQCYSNIVFCTWRQKKSKDKLLICVHIQGFCKEDATVLQCVVNTNTIWVYGIPGLPWSLILSGRRLCPSAVPMCHTLVLSAQTLPSCCICHFVWVFLW